MNKRTDQRAPQRKKIHRRDKLVSTQRKGYKRRWVNDEPGRIQMFKEAGWNIVEEPNELKANDGAPSAPGKQAVQPVGGGQSGYLMEIREEWWHEDQAEKEEHRKQKEQSLLNDEDGRPRNDKTLYGEGVTIDRPRVKTN